MVSPSASTATLGKCSPEVHPAPEPNESLLRAEHPYLWWSLHGWSLWAHHCSLPPWRSDLSLWWFSLSGCCSQGVSAADQKGLHRELLPVLSFLLCAQALASVRR